MTDPTGPSGPTYDLPQDPPKKSLSWFEDLALLFISPSGVFERRRQSGFGMPLLILVAATAIVVFATLSAAAPYWDAQYLISAQQAAEAGREMPTTPQAMAMGRYFGAGAQVILIPIVVVIFAIFVLLGARIAGAKITYKQSALIFTLAGFPRLIDTLALGVQGLLLDPATIRGMTDGSLSPARFLDPTTANPIVLGLVSSLSVGSIWAWLLVAVGIKVLGRTSWGNALFGMFIAFAVSTALFLIPAALFS